MSIATVTRPASDNQRVFARNLLLEVAGLQAALGQDVKSAEMTAYANRADMFAGLDFDAASAKLTAWTAKADALRAEVRKVSPAAVVLPGMYALEVLDKGAANDVAFYRVDLGTGKWNGYTFVSLIVGPDERPVPRNQRAGILARIAADPKAASARYGRKSRKCGVCGRNLTNKESREYGIGPKCRGGF